MVNAFHVQKRTVVTVFTKRRTVYGISTRKKFSFESKVRRRKKRNDHP